MTMKYILIAALSLGVLRFAWLIFNGWRTGSVKGSSPFMPAVSRAALPAVYWMRMVVHAFVVVAFCGLIIALLLGFVAPPK